MPAKSACQLAEGRDGDKYQHRRNTEERAENYREKGDPASRDAEPADGKEHRPLKKQRGYPREEAKGQRREAPPEYHAKGNVRKRKRHRGIEDKRREPRELASAKGDDGGDIKQRSGYLHPGIEGMDGGTASGELLQGIYFIDAAAQVRHPVSLPNKNQRERLCVRRRLFMPLRL